MLDRDLRLSRVTLSDYLLDRHSVAFSGFIKVNPAVDYENLHKVDQLKNEPTVKHTARVAEVIPLE